MERTDGAPEGQIPTDLNEYGRELERSIANGTLTVAEAAAKWARRRDELAASAPPPPSPAQAERRARFDREVQDAERGLAEMRSGATPSGTDDMPYGTGRRRNPVSRLQQEGIDMMNARQFGTRYGGGAPFTSKEEAEAYERRNLLSEAEKRELRRQGVSERDIIDMQRSEFDRAAAQTGPSGGTGWVPVYAPNGTVTYLQRGTNTGFEAAGVPGASNMAEGMRRTGPRVEAGHVRPDLNTVEYENMMEDRGYTLVDMPGPYGIETVWKKTKLGKQTTDQLREEGRLMVDPDGDGPEKERPISLQEYQARSRQENLKRGLALKAGLSPQEAADMSVQNLRDMIATNRMRDKNERSDAARRARMAPRMRNEFELGRMGDNWRNAVAAQQFGMRGPTPLGVEQAQALAAFEQLRSALQGGAGGSAVDLLQQQAQLADVTGDNAVRLSIQRGERMGQGLSAGHVLSRYRHWMLDPGFRGPQDRETNFRREMEALGYQPADIDAFLDEQVAAGNVAPSAPAASPDETLPPAGGRMPL